MPGKAHRDSYGGSFIQWSLVEPPDFDGNGALRPGAMVGYATEKRRGGISPMACLLGWGALRTYRCYVWPYWYGDEPVAFYASEYATRRRRPRFSGMLEPTTDPNERQRAITSLEQDLSRIAQILGNIIEKTVLP